MAIAIKEQLEKLKSKDRNKRLDAANALGNAALNGEDINAASGALDRALSDEDDTVRVRAAYALATHYVQKENLDAVKKLIESKEQNIRYGAAQGLGSAKGMAISSLVPALEKGLAEATDNSLRSQLVALLASFYLRNEMVEKATGMLRHEDKNVRSRAASSYMIAAMNGTDISIMLQALKGALGDKEQEVRHYAAEALVGFHAQRKQWKEIDELLVNKDSTVRYSVVSDLQSHVGSFDIRSDIPNLLKILDDNDFDVRKGAISIFKMVAEKGLDISFAVPALKKAAIYGDEEVKEAVENVLKAYELRKEPGQRCKYCLNCETGLGPGNESKSFEVLGTIVKEISCCGGDVTHTIFRCTRCGKYYLSSYYDHTGFEAEQFSIVMIDKADAEQLADEIRKCKEPENPDCGCAVHTALLKYDAMPVKGVIKYKATID